MPQRTGLSRDAKLLVTRLDIKNLTNPSWFLLCLIVPDIMPIPQNLCFSISLPLLSPCASTPNRSISHPPARFYPSHSATWKVSLSNSPAEQPASNPEQSSSDSNPRPNSPQNLFVNGDEQRRFINSLDINTAFNPLTPEEKQKLREKLPKQVAEFLIRRADAAVEQRDLFKKGKGKGIWGTLLEDLEPEVIDWESQSNDEFSDYVYDSVAQKPGFVRRGSRLFGGGDGVVQVSKEDTEEGTKGTWSLFVGNPSGINEQASKVGYGVLALLVALLLFKVVIALVSFFVSFTFSFFAIFALSAGIFVVFFLLRF